MTIVMMMLFPLTMAAESVGYVVFNSENGTLTFKYGEKPTAGTNEEVYDLDAVDYELGWYDKRSAITKVVFESSFSQVQPNSCCKWFYGCSNLTTIEGISYLNTTKVFVIMASAIPSYSLVNVLIEYLQGVWLFCALYEV